MSQRELVGAVQEVPVRRSRRWGFTLDVSRMNFADGFLAGWRRPCRRPSTPWTRWRRAPSPTRTRSAWSGHYWLRAPELAPKPELAPSHHATRSRTCTRSPTTCTTARVAAAEGASASRTLLVDRHRRLGARARSSWRDALGDAGGPGCSVYFFDNTDPGRHGPRARRSSAASSTETLVVVISQVRRHQGDAQRHAGGRAPPTSSRASTSRKHAVAVTGDGSELDQLRREQKAGSRASRCGTGSAGAPRELSRGRPAARGAAGHRHRRACSTARARHGRGDARSTTRARTRPRCWR